MLLPLHPLPSPPQPRFTPIPFETTDDAAETLLPIEITASLSRMADDGPLPLGSLTPFAIVLAESILDDVVFVDAWRILVESTSAPLLRPIVWAGIDDGERCGWLWAAWCGGNDSVLVAEAGNPVGFGEDASMGGGFDTEVDLLLVASRGEGELADNVLREFVSGIMVARRL